MLTGGGRANQGFEAVTRAGARAVAAVMHDPRHTLLALDFDGTLAQIVPDPSDARMFPASRVALWRLLPVLGTVVVVTGREARTMVRLADLDAEPRPANLVVLAQYGAERWESATDDYREPPVPPSVRLALDRVFALVERHQLAGDDVAGIRVEDKGRAIGFHTRQTRDPQATLHVFDAELRAIAAEFGLTVEPGRAVLELRGSSADKGQALAAIVAERAPTVVVYGGDDLGDLAAFDRIAAWQQEGRAAVGVVAASAEQPDVAAHADVLCDGPAGLAAWLTTLADALGV